MIRSLAMNPKLIGLWHWSGVVRADNHEAIVPIDLFLEAYELAARRGKPRGKGIKFDPLEWSGLLYCCNHDPPIRISGNAASNSYRCQTEYFRGRGCTCLDISARYLDEPLTTTVLGQLHFSPLADEVLAQLEKEATRVDLEAEQTKCEIAHLENKLENLKSYLGCGDKEREDVYWEQYTKVKNRLEELRSRPVSQQVSNRADYHLVRSFLAGLPDKFATYPRGVRNRLLRILIDRVEIRHPEHDIEARIHWKTDQVQVLHIKRARAKGNREMRWSKEELSLLQMLWPNASQETILAALPGRTCKGIAHQANIRGWKRSSSVARPISRRRWTVDETEKTRELYELGIPLQDIMSRMERSRTAILQRASEENWHRPLSNQKPTSHLFWYEESPILVNGISSVRGYRG
jgi:hypothetical protein